ncbi:MAG: serine--tRNA ligase [Patescibacteria group bacterium]|nr:serine--tRNA ligase [Patescibacteria group bacterium]
MLDIKYIRENAEKIKQAIKNKNINLDLDELLILDEQRRKLQFKIDESRTEKNKIAESAKGKGGKPHWIASTQRGKPTKEQIEAGKKIKTEINNAEEQFKKIAVKYKQLLYAVPNTTSEDTPIGLNESGNKVIRKFGAIPKFDFKPKNHMELGVAHNIIDTEKSAIISGARFNYLFGEAVLLQFAILQFTLQTLTDQKIIKKLADKVGNPFDKPFIPVIPPVIAKSEIMKKMDRLDPIEDRYYLEQDDSLLIGSAEHTLGPLHMNEIIDEKKLPIRYIGYSTAFRREAGTYGKDMVGILRRHQFDKAEMETFIQPEHGIVEQDLIIAIQEYLVQQLELPYQVVAICTGDMGKQDFRQIDIECFMPSENKYRETHTSDYMTDYQSRRLNIRYKNKNNEKNLVHMNDATAFAMGRILIAILENYQQANGNIIIPKVLRKYMPNNQSLVLVKK